MPENSKRAHVSRMAKLAKVGPDFAMCVASSSAMCRTEMPPLLAHSATLPDRHQRRVSRPWHDASHGEVVGRVHWGQQSTSPCMSNHFSADAVVWVWA